MSYEHTKVFLLQYSEAQGRVKRLSNQLELLRQGAEIKAARIHAEGFIRKSADRVSDPTGSYAAKFADMELSLIEAQAQALDAMETVCSILDALPDPVHSQLLFDRYILGHSWDQVAKDLKLNPVHVRGRLLTAALNEVQKILTERDMNDGTL